MSSPTLIELVSTMWPALWLLLIVALAAAVAELVFRLDFHRARGRPWAGQFGHRIDPTRIAGETMPQVALATERRWQPPHHRRSRPAYLGARWRSPPVRAAALPDGQAGQRG